ncbi:MAG: hypothetical protein U0136_03395 [Bdellovibrionota bacterium]
MSDSQDDQQKSRPEAREANAVIALGVGVAALGAGGALLSAAVCPVCVVVAPALIGAGTLKRIRLARKSSESEGPQE